MGIVTIRGVKKNKKSPNKYRCMSNSHFIAKPQKNDITFLKYMPLTQSIFII